MPAGALAGLGSAPGQDVAPCRLVDPVLYQQLDRPPVWPDWIEAISGWDPDQYDGAVGWLIALGLLAVTPLLLTVTAGEWRRTPVTE